MVWDAAFSGVKDASGTVVIESGLQKWFCSRSRLCEEDDGEKIEVLRVKCGGQRRAAVADGDGGSRWRG